jgi:hypothetical protein
LQTSLRQALATKIPPNPAAPMVSALSAAVAAGMLIPGATMNRRILLCTCLALFVGIGAVARAEDPQQPKPRQPPRGARAQLVPGIRAEVKKVGIASITVLPEPPRMSARPRPQEKQQEKGQEKQKPQPNPPAKPPAPREQMLVVDKNTQVFVGVITGEREGPRGQKIRTTQFNRGEFSDVKVGQKVLLQSTGEHADRINILPPEAPAAGEGL